MTHEARRDLERVEAWVREGRTEDARESALKRDTKEVRDREIHLRWASLLEELGLYDQVVLELNLALREDPGDTQTLERLAEVYLDQNQAHKAAHCWSRMLQADPGKPKPYRKLGEILEESGEFEKALKVYEKGLERTGDATFNGLIRALGFLRGEKEPPESAEEFGVLAPESHHLITFLSLFAGREGVYARQWVSPTGESGYTPVHEPFTVKTAEQHITGSLTAGVYPVRLDNTVSFLAFDLDVAKPVVRDTIGSERAWNKVMAEVHKMACALTDAAASADLPVVLEDSGFKGRHVWIFLDVPTSAGVARKCGHLLMNQLGPLPREVTVEVFPRQSSVRPGSLGNLIKLPLGVHRKTGRRAVFIQPDGAVAKGQLEFLEQVVRAPRRAVYAYIQRMGVRPEVSVRTESPPEAGGEESAPSPVERAEAIYDLGRDLPLQYILSRCFVLRSIVERIFREANVSRDEAQVLIHSLGHLEHGPIAVNELFQRCVNADPSLFLKSRLRGHPVSCPKIRLRVPHITSTGPCNCRFDPSINLYPNPLNHLYGLVEDSSARVGPQHIHSLQFHNLLDEYLKAQRQLREIGARLERLERELHAFFEQAGIDEFRTSLGVLKRLKKDDASYRFLLEM